MWTAVLALARLPGLFWSSEAQGIATNLNNAYDALLHPHGQPDNKNEARDVVRIEAAIWDLITAGIVYPRHGRPSGNAWEVRPLLIDLLVVTPLGQRYLAEKMLHPASPDFISNALVGLSDLPPEVRAALEDAQLCFQHRLLRASVVQLGLAFEAMASEIWGVVVRKNQSAKPREAKAILDEITKAVAERKDEAASRAVSVAEEIRGARNKAAHNWKHDFTQVDEVERLLILGGRNVGAFWRLHSP